MDKLVYSAFLYSIENCGSHATIFEQKALCSPPTPFAAQTSFAVLLGALVESHRPCCDSFGSLPKSLQRLSPVELSWEMLWCSRSAEVKPSWYDLRWSIRSMGWQWYLAFWDTCGRWCGGPYEFLRNLHANRLLWPREAWELSIFAIRALYHHPFLWQNKTIFV